MSWKPPRRTLHSVSKVKLTHGHPLPECVGDATPVNEELVVTGQTHSLNQKNDSDPFSGFLSSLPVASQLVENNYFAKFDKASEFDNRDNADIDADIDQLFFSDLGGTDGSSTLDNSSASFLSWADDVELQEAARTRALFEELEVALYDDGTSSLKNGELLNECIAWKNSQVNLRVLGKNISNTQVSSEDLGELEDEISDEEEDGEIIASHGFLEESPKYESSIHSDSGSSKSNVNIVCGENLTEKVKMAALEQLTLYALSEALKFCEQDQQAGDINVRQNLPVGASETLANLSEDLGRVLQISGRSIHRSPKMLNVESGKKSLFSNSPEHIQVGIQSKRFLSSIDAIPEDKISIDSSFSVLGLPKPLNSELFNSKTKSLEKRGFHSAADRKRPGILDRRFSCISPEHDRLLKPLDEIGECVRNSSGKFQGFSNSKQVSAPNTPLKFLRHLTLPPIQNLNSFNKLSVSSEEKIQPSLSNIRRIFVKNKVSLTPLPNAVNTPEGGHMELQVAKQMLDSTPDSGRWSSCRKLGFSGNQNIKSRKRSIEKNISNI